MKARGLYMQQADDCSAMADRCGDFVLKEKWLRLAIEWIALEAEVILALPLAMIAEPVPVQAQRRVK